MLAVFPQIENNSTLLFISSDGLKRKEGNFNYFLNNGVVFIQTNFLKIGDSQ